jgi:hypothetical protein
MTSIFIRDGWLTVACVPLNFHQQKIVLACFTLPAYHISCIHNLSYTMLIRKTHHAWRLTSHHHRAPTTMHTLPPSNHLPPLLDQHQQQHLLMTSRHHEPPQK